MDKMSGFAWYRWMQGGKKNPMNTRRIVTNAINTDFPMYSNTHKHQIECFIGTWLIVDGNKYTSRFGFVPSMLVGGKIHVPSHPCINYRVVQVVHGPWQNNSLGPGDVIFVLFCFVLDLVLLVLHCRAMLRRMECGVSRAVFFPTACSVLCRRQVRVAFGCRPLRCMMRYV